MSDLSIENGQPKSVWPERLDRRTYRFLSIIAAAFLAIYILLSIGVSIRGTYWHWFFSRAQWLPLSLISGCTLLMCALLYRSLRGSGAAIGAIAILCLALLPRLMLSLWIEYIPTEDFKLYSAATLGFANHDPAPLIRMAEGWGLPDLLGYGVINGLIMRLFPRTVSGMQLEQAAITSLVCVLIYLIGRRYDQRAGLLGAMAFAVDPANIVMSQVTTNQHLSALFGISAVFCLLAAARAKRIGWAAVLGLLTALLLVLQQYAHPSSLPTRIACFLWILLLLVRAFRDKKRLIRLGAVVLALAAGLFGGKALGTKALERADLYHAERYSSTSTQDWFIFKILTGLNPESGGSLSYDNKFANENSELAFSHSGESRLKPFMAAVWERIHDPRVFASTLIKKTVTVWCSKNGAYDAYAHGLFIYGMDTPYSNEPLGGLSYARLYDFIKTYALADHAVQTLIYLFAALGVLLRRRAASEAPDLVLWVALGWMGIMVLTEAATRYNYYAMSFLCVLAGIGAHDLAALFQKAWAKRAGGRPDAGTAVCADRAAAGPEERA